MIEQCVLFGAKRAVPSGSEGYVVGEIVEAKVTMASERTQTRVGDDRERGKGTRLRKG
jgi:hypothetical protein